MKQQRKAWLYLLPALLFLAAFMVYPLIDVFIYSVEEGYNFASQTYFGVGLYNYSYVLHDPYFLQAVKNTVLLAMANMPRTLVLGILNCAAVLLCAAYVFPLFFLPALASLLSTWLLEPMFRPFLPKPEGED